jgi:hypothetical protein
MLARPGQEVHRADTRSGVRLARSPGTVPGQYRAASAGRDRWDALGWDTQAQALRIVQLGELVHFAPWDEQLRADWRARWEQVKKIGEATRDLAYMLTPQVIALTAWSDVSSEANQGL